jgi:hypothetical protein
MYRKIDRTGASLLTSLEESGYVPHSPVKKMLPWEECSHYSGVYETVHIDGSVSFVKSSMRLFNSFAFGDRETAMKHLRVYRKFSESGERFYDGRSFFAVEKGKKGYGVVACMPALLTHQGKKTRIGSFGREVFNSKWNAFFDRWPLGLFDGDVIPIHNYGLAEDGEFYYFDLHLFETIPSPLADDPRINKVSTSA